MLSHMIGCLGLTSSSFYAQPVSWRRGLTEQKDLNYDDFHHHEYEITVSIVQVFAMEDARVSANLIFPCNRPV